MISLICWWVSNNHHPSNTLAAPHRDPKSEEAKRSWSSWKACCVLFFLLPQAPTLLALGRPCAVTFIPNSLFFVLFYFHFSFSVFPFFLFLYPLILGRCRPIPPVPPTTRELTSHEGSSPRRGPLLNFCISWCSHSLVNHPLTALELHCSTQTPHSLYLSRLKAGHVLG